MRRRTRLGFRPPAAEFVTAPGAQWVALVDEGGTFVLPDEATVRYGASGTFNSLTLSAGTYTCGNALFGDPTPGVFKTCQLYVPPEFLTTPTIGWIPPFLAADGSELTDLLGIRVYRSTTDDFATADLMTDPYLDPELREWTDRSYELNVTYYYWVLAINDSFTESDAVRQIPRRYTA
jgi:hypothetical protein